MNNRRAKMMRQVTKERFGNVDPTYEKINPHLKSYGVDLVTGEPRLQQVSTVVLSATCGRKRYKQLKRANA